MKGRNALYTAGISAHDHPDAMPRCLLLYSLQEGKIASKTALGEVGRSSKTHEHSMANCLMLIFRAAAIPSRRRARSSGIWIVIGTTIAVHRRSARASNTAAAIQPSDQYLDVAGIVGLQCELDRLALPGAQR